MLAGSRKLVMRSRRVIPWQRSKRIKRPWIWKPMKRERYSKCWFRRVKRCLLGRLWLVLVAVRQTRIKEQRRRLQPHSLHLPPKLVEIIHLLRMQLRPYPKERRNGMLMRRARVPKPLRMGVGKQAKLLLWPVEWLKSITLIYVRCREQALVVVLCVTILRMCLNNAKHLLLLHLYLLLLNRRLLLPQPPQKLNG